MLSIGIDIGGTKIAGALVDETGQILLEDKVASPVSDSKAMIDEIVGLINRLSNQRAVVGAGVAAAGFLSADRELLYFAPNINTWRNIPLRKLIADRVSVPVLLENDANAAGWAEFQFGAGRSVSSMVMLTIGTGVGGAIVSSGQLLQGGFGIGAELGHVMIEPNGKKCGCGLRGCLESYASGTAFLNSAIALADSNEPLGNRLRELKQANEKLDGEVLYQALGEEDPGAISLLNQVSKYLGLAIGACFVPVLDPELVVIGGGLSAIGEKFIAPIEVEALKNLPAREYRPKLKVVSAHFLNQAGQIGAADLARQRFS